MVFIFLAYFTLYNIRNKSKNKQMGPNETSCPILCDPVDF